MGFLGHTRGHRLDFLPTMDTIRFKIIVAQIHTLLSFFQHGFYISPKTLYAVLSGMMLTVAWHNAVQFSSSNSSIHAFGIVFPSLAYLFIASRICSFLIVCHMVFGVSPRGGSAMYSGSMTSTLKH